MHHQTMASNQLDDERVESNREKIRFLGCLLLASYLNRKQRKPIFVE
jgi:hypothetical protein